MKKKKRTVSLLAQERWFKLYPWLHCNALVDGVVCYHCAKAHHSGLLLQGKVEAAFTTKGVGRWKNALETFSAHEKSVTHRQAVSQLRSLSAPTISAQISASAAEEQGIARRILMILVRSARFLLRQGLAQRRNPEEEGNYQQLLRMQAEGDPDLDTWLQKKMNFTSHQCAEDMHKLMAHAILRDITNEARDSGIFSVVVDGTQDVSGLEQESICLRYIDKDLNVHEEFVGVYLQKQTTGEAVAETVQDVLIRLNLPISDLRGQTYDGASNMAGAYNGCQANIRKKNPLALHFKCFAHCINLVLLSAVESDHMVRDAVQDVHEVGKLFKRSGKYSSVFSAVVADHTESPSRATLKPLCPTRWTCRRRSLSAVLENYSDLLTSLAEFGKEKSESASKARRLEKRFMQTETLLGVNIAHEVALQLEGLNEIMQGRQMVITGALEALSVTKKHIQALRTDDHFSSLLNAVVASAKDMDMEPLVLPRPTRPPARYSGCAPAYQPPSVEDKYRQTYFSVMDTVTTELESRFDTTSTSGLSAYTAMTNTLTTAKVDKEQLEKYPEIDCTRLQVQLDMWHTEFGAQCSVFDIRNKLREMEPETRRLFRQVETLLRLMLVCPVSSCEAERSFSALRLVKSRIRSSMGQVLLNNALMCTVHKFRLDKLETKSTASQWVKFNVSRGRVFGNM